MRRIAMLAIFAIAASACMHDLPPDSPDHQALVDVKSAWDLASLPPLGDCLDRVEVVRHETKTAYVAECEGMSPGAGGRKLAEHSAGCLTYGLRGVLGKQVALINLAPGYHDDMGLVQHECLHHASACALGRRASDPFDSGHRDPRIWSAAGGATSVQARSSAPAKYS